MQATPNRAYIRATKVTGTPVYNPEGEKLGSIEDIVLTKVEGQAAFAVLSFGGFLGMGEKHYPVPWSLLSYDTGQGGYVVNLKPEQLESAPSHPTGENPDWDDPAYHTRVTDHYSPPVIDPVEGERPR